MNPAYETLITLVLSQYAIPAVGLVVGAAATYALAQWSRLTGQKNDTVQADQLKTAIMGALQAAIISVLRSSPSSTITEAIISQAIKAVPGMVAQSNAGNIRHFGGKASPAALQNLATAMLPAVLHTIARTQHDIVVSQHIADSAMLGKNTVPAGATKAKGL